MEAAVADTDDPQVAFARLSEAARRAAVGGLGKAVGRRSVLTLLTIAPLAAFVACSGDTSAPVGTEAPPGQSSADPVSSAAGAVSSDVFLTKDISAVGLLAAYRALGRPLSGRVAIKIHMGEPGNTNFLSPDLLRDLVREVNGTFVDADTYYGGARADAASHRQVADDHGFSYAPVDILDADGEISLPIQGGRLQRALIGSHYADYDAIVSVAHFKGHSMAGFGGTLKNIAVGMASVAGKGEIHGGWSATTSEFLEHVAEYTKAIADDRGDRIVYLNVLNNLSVDCDCDGNAAHPQLDDIGILASLDPVALDRASVDLVYEAPEDQRRHLVERIESRSGTQALDYAESLGAGSQTYTLTRL